MTIPKPVAHCLSFSWASCLVDLYAAYHTDYWSMLFTTVGVRVGLTTIALCVCAYSEHSRSAQAEAVEKLHFPSQEPVPGVRPLTAALASHTQNPTADAVHPPAAADAELPPEFVAMDSADDFGAGDVPDNHQPAMG
jgi:hypothetical protein